MDEATKLVVELSKKLTELDHKVDLYRKDMNSEYIKYEEDLLKNVSSNIHKKVETMIAEELKNYKALYPFATTKDTDTDTDIAKDTAKDNHIDNFDSRAEIGTETGTGSKSNTLNITSNSHANDDNNTNFITNGFIPKAMESQLGTGTEASKITTTTTTTTTKEEERPRSPHAREKEFTGVFTPSYLPLLDSSSRYERRSDSNIQIDNKSKTTEMDSSSHSNVDASTDTRSLDPSPHPRSPIPIEPKRRNTDEISIASNSSSDGPRRRSALRRSSTGNSKSTSPRRVRFDVEGEEVLPTVSPKEMEPILPPSFSDDSDDEAGSEMVEDIDAPPPPKRISSSQALRALSRGPIEDDGTQWTTVVAPPDGSASVSTSEDISNSDYFDSKLIPTTSRDENIPPFPVSIPTKIPQLEPQAHVEHVEALPEDDTDALSEDDMLDMPPLRQMRSQNQNKLPASILSPRKNENGESTHSLLKKSSNKPFTLSPVELGGEDKGNEKTDLTFNKDEDEDDLFSFDENPVGGNRPLPQDEDEEDEGDDKEVEAEDPPSSNISDNNLELSKSPARPIPNFSSSSYSNNNIKKPTTPTTPAPTHGIVGSYKGRPFSMPVVNDDVHASAAQMGNMNSFVGSVNGRSGLDASDVLSFRTSGVGSFSGAPRSMSERLALEEVMEERVREKGEGRNEKN